MNSFFEKNQQILSENPDFVDDFQKITKLQKFEKNAIIHTSGKICNHFYIVVHGIARVFYFKEGKDITCHFALEQETFTAIDSFLQHKKSKYNIEALEELQVLAISHDDLDLLFKKHPNYEQFGRLFLQHIYIDLVERIDDMQLYTAQERYDILLSKNPELFKRVASKHIATYLSMTPETFSRIRGK